MNILMDHGKSSPFLEKAFRYNLPKQPDDHDKIVHALGYLTGTALEWSNELKGEVLNDWTLFVVRLHARFSDHNEVVIARNSLAYFRQCGQFATIETYTAEFHRLNALVELGENSIHFYNKGRKDHLQVIWAGMPLSLTPKMVMDYQRQTKNLLINPENWNRQNENRSILRAGTQKDSNPKRQSTQ